MDLAHAPPRACFFRRATASLSALLPSEAVHVSCFFFRVGEGVHAAYLPLCVLLKREGGAGRAWRGVACHCTCAVQYARLKIPMALRFVFLGSDLGEGDVHAWMGMNSGWAVLYGYRY